MTDTTYTIVGGGAIGGVLAHRLVRAGQRVRIVDTDPDHVAAIRRNGLVLLRESGAPEVARVEAMLPEDHDGPLHTVLLAVKAQASATALEWIAPRLAPDGCVVSMQNGFNEDVISERVGPGRTVAAFVNIFADVVEPGVIRDGGAGALVVGEADGGPVSERVRRLVGHLGTDDPAVAGENVEGYLWAKAGFGAMLAATALADAPMADLIERHADVMAALAAEVFTVSDGLGIALEAFDAFEPDTFRAGAGEDTRAGATARLTRWLRTQPKNRSGIWRDLAVRGRPVEVTTHYEVVFAHAARQGISTPVLRAVIDGLVELERDPAGMSEDRLVALRNLIPGAPGREQPHVPPSAPSVSPRDAERVSSWLTAHHEAMEEDLAAFTGLESPSDDEALLAECAAWLRGWLDERLGTDREEEVLARHGAGDILIRRHAGTGARPLLLLGHYDTVWPAGTLAQRPYRRDGDRITGPGVFDMKAGLVQAVWALKALDALGLPRPGVTLLINGDEETGSLASKDVIMTEARRSRATLVFEASAAGGALKTARKGVGLFQVTITGQEGHAGLDPHRGASAVDELARQILCLADLRDPAAGTSVNVGVVSGGTRPNVTAGRAVAELDVRVASRGEEERVSGALNALTPHDPRTTVTVTGGWNRPVFARGPGVAALADLARGCASLLGEKLGEASVGGASDGNFAAAAGSPVLDGLGAVGDGAHAASEYALASGLVRRAGLAALVITSLA
ncbi:M20/M25/M40 family metallo-hydrolase [Streptomyces sp. NPDC001185]|uniref:M20/M25/M40 family metallo-hydrolase n=1 Tax=Streptomyces sp. NPDC001185 TaxID=3154380 RepID=UPI00331DA422